MAIVERKAKLEACLDAASVSAEAKTFLMTDLGLETLEDMVGYVPEASYEVRIAEIMEPRRNGGNAIPSLNLQVSRVRTA